MSNAYLQSGRTNQKQETRSKILAGAAYFLNKGLSFNLDDIAKRTGISRATVYRYFSNSDILAAEAGLQVSTKSPKAILEPLDQQNLEATIYGIQHYYNQLTLDNEQLFRKYISAVLDPANTNSKRGARRKKTLKLALEKTDLNPKDQEKLSNLITLFMGVEPMIVTKDVCGLNDSDSLDLLQWGLNLVLAGLKLNNSK